jgi:hypothetical protein
MFIVGFPISFQDGIVQDGIVPLRPELKRHLSDDSMSPLSNGARNSQKKGDLHE